MMHQKLRLQVHNIRGDIRVLDDGIFGGYYDSLKNRYVFVVTAYVQDLIDGSKIDYGTFLAPTTISATSFAYYTPSATSASRAVIGSFGNTTNRLKLNIYYTKIN
jgi:hypothetical protein